VRASKLEAKIGKRGAIMDLASHKAPKGAARDVASFGTNERRLSQRQTGWRRGSSVRPILSHLDRQQWYSAPESVHSGHLAAQLGMWHKATSSSLPLAAAGDAVRLGEATTEIPKSR
jgi:hypothetical protein